MNTSNSSKDQLFEVLQSAEEARNTEIIAPVLANSASDISALKAKDWKAMIIDESVQLVDRINFLRKHPKLPIFLGGCAVKVESFKNENPRVLSEPVMAIEAELIGDHTIRSYLQFGFTSFQDFDPYNLKIYNTVEDVETGSKKRNTLYTITGSVNNASHPGFHRVTGKELDDYSRAKRHEIFTQYKVDNPWAENFMIFSDNGSWTTIPNRDGNTHKERQQVLKQEAQIWEELIPQLEPGVSWDFPDSLYYYPLGLVRQANRIFGTKQR
jgi:hypothetical protein